MSQPTVLVVDDERFFREAIQDVLQPRGIHCRFAADGQEALEAATDPEVGVVVLDLVLPDLHGLEVFRRLADARPDLPVVILSAHTDQENVLEALRLGAFDYLAKPLHEEELGLVVERALSTWALQSGWSTLRGRLNDLEVTLLDLAWRAAEGPPEALPDVVVAAAQRVIGAERCSFLRLGDDGVLRVVAVTGSKRAPEQHDPVALGEGAAGIAVARQEAFVVPDVDADPRFAGRVPMDRYRTGSFAIAPLVASGRVLGAVCATDRTSGPPLGAEDLSLLRILAGQAARWIEAAPLDADTTQEIPALEDPEGDAELLREICEAMTEEVDPARLLAAALRPVAERLGAGPVSLYLATADGDLRREAELDRAISSDRPVLPRGRGLVGVAFETGRLVASEEPASDPRFDPEVDTAADGEPRPLVCAPLRFKRRTLGVFRAFPQHAEDARPETAQLLSAALSSAVRIAQLSKSLVASYEDLARARRAASPSR